MVNFNTDTPITSAKEDKFGRIGFAKQIAGLCSGHNSTSKVIGVYGKWGEGKTSLMNLVSESLEQRILQIQFNPWYFKDEEELLNAFFKVLADKLGRRLNTTRNRVNNLIADYSESLGVLDVIPDVSGVTIVLKAITRFFKGKKKTDYRISQKSG